MLDAHQKSLLAYFESIVAKHDAERSGATFTEEHNLLARPRSLSPYRPHDSPEERTSRVQRCRRLS
jgi:hypothetical protein